MWLTETRKSAAGFTLIEIIVVIVIIGSLAAFLIPRIYGQSDDAKARLAKTMMLEIAGKMELFKLDVGRYPNSGEGIKALVANPGGLNNWNGPYLREEQSKDPWNNEFIFTAPGKSGPFEIKSLGADGKEGGEGPNRDVSL
jgi:general secretion pathway protein G